MVTDSCVSWQTNKIKKNTHLVIVLWGLFKIINECATWIHNLLAHLVISASGSLSTQALILSLGVTSVANSQLHAERVYRI